MANVDKAFGFRLARIHGSMSTPIIECQAASGTAAMAVGDIVKPTGTGTTAGLIGVERAAATNVNMLGVIVGFKATGPDSLAGYRGNTGAERFPQVAVLVPGMELIVNLEDSAAITQIGSGFDLIDAGPNTTTGASGMELDQSSSGSGVQFIMIGIERTPDNSFDTSAAGTNVRVVPIESALFGGGVGT